MLHNGTINNTLSRQILQEMLEHSDRKPSDIADAKNLKQISDPAAIEQICRDILDGNRDAVQQYKQGKEKLFGFLIGQVAKVTEQRANMELVDKTMKALLKK